MRRALAICVVAVATACTPAPGTESLAPTSPAQTAPAAAAASTTTTVTAPPTTATTTTTTTLAAPPPRITLDRSEAATSDRLGADADHLLGIGAREAGTDAEGDAAEWLARSLRALGLAVTIEPVPLPNGRDSQNVIAQVGAGETHVIVGAHMDTIAGSPGLDDNGSGVIVLRELARRYAATPPPVKVTIVFFGAEEILSGYSRNFHHFGSRQMAERLGAAADLPDSMISVDMVGVGDTLLAVTYRDTDPEAADAVASAAEELGIDITRQSRGDISDHEGFARQGIPSVMLWRPDNPDYHSAGDDTVRIEALIEVLAIVEELLG